MAIVNPIAICAGNLIFVLLQRVVRIKALCI